MARKSADDHVAAAAAESEQRRSEFAAEQDERKARLDAIREEGRAQRARDQEEHDRGVYKEALAAYQARQQAAQAERDEIAGMYDEVRRVKAQQDEAFDREFAKLLAKRREDELDPENDYSVGPQVTLDPKGLIAKCARGGAARSLERNVEIAQIATAEEEDHRT